MQKSGLPQGEGETSRKSRASFSLNWENPEARQRFAAAKVARGEKDARPQKSRGARRTRGRYSASSTSSSPPISSSTPSAAGMTSSCVRWNG